MWKPVKDYEGYYEINEYGVVRSLDRYITKSNGVVQFRKSKIMSQNLDSCGYTTVKLSKNGKSERLRVARLVGFAFVDGYKDGLEINHIDCDRTNSYYKNLEWVTHQENVAYTKSLKRHVSDRDITGKNNPNYGNHTLRDRFANEPELRKVQSRPGLQNGRCRKVKLIDGDNEILFDYLSECADYLINNKYCRAKKKQSVATRIRMSAEENKESYGFMFELI